MNFRIISKASLRLLVASSLALPLLTACETDEDRALAEAEHCINKSDSSNVDQCVARVAGIQSKQAYLIRCSAHFIAQNLTADKLALGFANIKNTSGSGTPATTTALSYLVFNEALTNHNIATSMNDCQLSGATSLYRITLLANVATTAVLIASGLPATGNQNSAPDSTAIKAAIASFGGSNPVDLGNMAINIRDNFCVNGSSFNSSDICSKVNAAYLAGGGDPSTIGSQIASLLQ